MKNKELGLIVVKQNKFEIIRRKLLILIWGSDYKIMQEIDELTIPKKIDTRNIIIPKEIGRK